MDSNTLNYIGSVASITGLATSLAQWLDTCLHNRTKCAVDKRSETIQDYLEWLRRREHFELIEKINESQEALHTIDVFIRGTHEQSEVRLIECIQQMEKSAQNFEVILQRFIEIQRQLQMFSTRQPESNEEQEFENEYLQQVQRSFSRLKILGVRETRDIKQQFALAYISLELAISREDKQFINAEQALRDEPLMTIRGAAGSGKTTLLSWIALQCSVRDENVNPWFGGVPFFVALRKLEGRERRHPDMNQFTQYTIDHKVWSLPPPRKWLSNVLDSKRGVLLIDGVDELPARDRGHFWRWLDDFVDLCPGNRVYITSRFFPEKDHGNQELLWHPPKSFVSAELREMNDGMVLEFINNWHDAVIDTGLDSKELVDLKKARDSLPGKLRELANRRVRDLCRTPLLCALICALHWRESGYLPKQRVDLYDRCCTMLIDERDLKRDVPLPDGPLGNLTLRDKEMILQRLALDMMRNYEAKDDRYNIEVSRSDALRWIKPNVQLLDQSIFKDCTCEDILDYLIVRTGLLREPSKGRIDFVHRTFQEYLAACAAGALNQTGYLVSKTEYDQWHETIVLSAGTKVGGVIFGNALVEMLLAKGEANISDTSISKRCFALAVACLETGHQLNKDLRERVLTHLDHIIPPLDSSESRILAAAGNEVLSLLNYRQLRHLGVDIVAASAHTIAMIGSKRAVDMLLEPHGYGNDRRATVLARICECWAIDANSVPRIKKILEDPINEIPQAIRPFFKDITPLLPVADIGVIVLNGYSGVSDISPFGKAPWLRRIEMLNMLSLTDLSPLAGLNRVEYLKIRDCPGISDINPLSQLKSLQQLELSGLIRVEDLSPISGLTRIKRLSLRGMRHVDLGNLTPLFRLESLDLTGSSGLKEIDVLGSLNNLTEVIVDRPKLEKFRSILGEKISTLGWEDEFAD